MVQALPIHAQSPEDAAPIQGGPFAVQPAFQVHHLGMDSNVFSTPDGERKTADLTARISAAADVWIRLPKLRVVSRSRFDYYYFREVSQLRSLDPISSVRVELPLNRITPYVAGTVAQARHSQNFEIDSYAEHTDLSAQFGAMVRLTRRFSVDARVTRTSVDYQGNSIYLGRDLAELFNNSSTGEGLALRFAATPLTTVGVEVERSRTRFTTTSERNFDGLWILPTVEFKPSALVSGRASVGWLRHESHDPGIPDFSGPTFRLDLSYTLLGRTQFAVVGGRGLAFSYLTGRQDYLETGVTTTVTHRLADPWDVTASVGRSRLGYRQIPLLATPDDSAETVLTDNSAETVLTYGAEVGYRLPRVRVALLVNVETRQSDVAASREYNRLWVGSSFTYRF